MTLEEAFGTVIRRFRKELQLSQEELSRISSLDRVFISQLERGKQQPTLVTIFELAAAMKVPVATILTETELLLRFREVKPYWQGHKPITKKKCWEQFGENIINNDSCIPARETILLVDDSKDLLLSISGLLASQGYNVIIAEDGRDAVNIYEENMDRIDLVVMDVMMPRENGIAAHKEISRLNPDARILLMSGYSPTSLSNTRGLNFIQKNMLPAMLFNKIRELLDSKSEKSLMEPEALTACTPTGEQT